MDKRFQTRLIFGIFLISIFSLSFVLASGGDENPIGYKIYDDTIEIWNTQDNYFFNKSSGIQFTNHYQDYWTRNIFCLGYYNNDEWNKIKCADELGKFNRDIKTDNETYVNATLWKDINYNGYDMRLGVKYHLGLDDRTLSVTIYGKNIGIDIPYDLGFAWKITDVNIPESSNSKSQPYGDSIEINGTRYKLNDTMNLLFKNITKVQNITTYDNETNTSLSEIVYAPIPFFRMQDWTKFLRLDWNKNLDYAVKMYGNGNQENFYVALLINAGHFNPQDEKSIIINWIDAEGAYISSFPTSNELDDGTAITTDGNYIWVSDPFDEEVYRYYMNGTYKNSFDTFAQDSNAYAMTTDGNYLFLSNYFSDRIDKFSMTGTYIDSDFDYSAQTNTGEAIATDGNFMWVASYPDDKVYKYYMNGTYIETIPRFLEYSMGITTDGNYIWVAEISERNITKKDMDWYDVSFFDVSGQCSANGLYGVTVWVDRIYALDRFNKEIHIYEGPAPVDTIPPNVTINSPIDKTYPTTSINFNLTAVDDTAVDSCWYTLNNGIDNTTMSNDTASNFYHINSSMSEGSHTVYFYCKDIYNNINNTEQVIFSIITDTTPPQTSTPIITPTQPKTTDDLKCNATLTDDKQTNLIAYWKWYKNGILNLSGTKTEIQNGTPTIITTLNSGITSKEENWKCEVLPYDGNNYGNAVNSTPVIILNTAPTHLTPILTTSTGKNLSTEDLTCYNQSTSDADDDEVINIYNWYKNNQPLAVLNLPFEGGSNLTYTKDYSGYENNDGTVSSNAVWKSSGGYDSKGAYDVTLNGATITILHKAALNPTDEITVMAWLKYNDTYCDSNYGGSAARPIAKGQNEAFELQTYEWVGGGCTARFCVNSTCPDLGVTSETEKGNWAHITGSFNGTHINTYFNGDLDVSIEYSGKIPFITDDLIIGDWTPNFGRGFMGIIDEVMIFDHALSAEQIKALYEGKTNLIVSEETSGGDNYMCQITPNDGEVDGDVLNSSSLEVLWEISFNVTSGEDGIQLNNFNINCNNSWSVTGVDSFEEFGFESGNYECTFSKFEMYDRIKIFTANSDRTIDVILSREFSLTIEEHTWLEALYNCIILGDCSLYNLLLEINNTVGNIWEHTKPTDESVITSETITNKVVDASNNLTIDYTVNIPIKAGYVTGTYLPVRIGFWFLDENNISCHDQGNKPTGVEEPYCQPLIIETIGPMGGSVSFTVEMRPELPAGDYSIKRIIDIDPLGVWYNYGQETIGMITLTESLIDSGIGLEKTGEVMPNTDSEQSSSSDDSSSSSDSSSSKTTIIKEREIITLVPQDSEDEDSTEEIINLNKPSITGGTIGTLLSGGQITLIIVVLAGVFVVFIIVTSKTILGVKKK